MIKKILLWRLVYFLLAIFIANNSLAELQTNSQLLILPSPALRNAVILIIRHAEKPESGFELSQEGQKRAEAYVNYFKTLTLDSQNLRPEPLSHALGLKIDNRFKNKNYQELVREIQARPHGKCILIAWHHGEIPGLIADLGADPAALLPGGKWPSEVFGWVLELRFDGEGRCVQGESKRMNENLMPGDSNH
jgi:hypothetical protein